MSDEISNAYKRILQEIGEDPSREGLLRTPLRAANAMRYLTRGYGMKLEDVLGGAIFEEDNRDMIVVRDIDFFSLCEHHVLPFFGKCHVAYIPSGKVIGLSKIPRIVELFSRRLQLQERLTSQIAGAIQEAISPMGVAVVMEAQHLCMMMRGVEKQNSLAVTSAMLGVFQRRQATRMEFLSLLGKGRA